MAITITGSKYSGTVSSYSNKVITISGATFVVGDFSKQRIVGLWSSGGVYKGLAWVRSFVSSSSLEMEFDFIDKDGLVVTPVSGDTFQVSLNYADIATTGIAVDNNTVTLTDGLVFGTASASDSVCFYDEAKSIDVENDGGSFCYEFLGGLFVHGHLTSYAERRFFNSVSLNSKDVGVVGDQIKVNNLSAKVWWLGGVLQFQVSPARLPGGQSGQPAEWQKWWGIETNCDLVTPGGGAAWSSDSENQQFVNCASIINSNNAIGFRLADSDFQGGFCKISGGSVISAFGADAPGTYNIGAPAGERFNILDIGTNLAKTAFWRKNNSTGSQVINATNVISTDFRIGATTNPGSTSYNNGTGTVNFKDVYRNIKPGTKLVINELNNGLQAASDQSVSGEDLELSVKYADLQGHTLTVNETDWQWAAIEYNRNIVSGLFSVSDVQTISGTAKDVKHGALLNQLTDNSITETDKTVTDGYVEIETSAKFYDRAKSFLVDNYAGETATIVSRLGDTINASAYNVTIDATAASAFAFEGSNITIKASIFTGSITTTGTVTLLNGATVQGIVSDSTGTTGILELL